MTRLTFDLNLTDDDLEALKDLQRITHRSRKNFCEALVIIAIKTHQKDCHLININELGTIIKN